MRTFYYAYSMGRLITGSFFAGINTSASILSAVIVDRKAVNVRSSLENTRSGVAVETGNVASTFSNKCMFG